jgi:GR25 family glycosyltransferase involved in LPS biosynthesis
MDKLDKIFLINLERRKDRLIHFINEVKRENIPLDKIQVFKAFDGKSPEFKLTENLKKLFIKADYLKTAFVKTIIANQLSHYYILKTQIEKNYKNILIFQDDVVLKNGFENDLIDILNNLPENYEILWIGLHKMAVFDKFIPWNINGKYETKSYIDESYNEFIGLANKNETNPCSLAYIISLEGAKNYIDHIEKNGFIQATDHNFNNYLRTKNIMYISKKVLCTGNNLFKSDVFFNQNDVSKN